MTNITNIAPAANCPTVRTIPEIEADILAQKRTIGASIVFIGRALEEAKAQLSHGEWGRWLAERVEFSASSAENYMRIAREFSGESKLLDMPYSKVLALLPVPREERESFADANDIKNKSVAQIKQLVKERDEAIAKARELESRKSERVTVEVIPPEYQKVMAERSEMEQRVNRAEEAVQTMIAERNEALSQMAREIAQAEEERDAALEELDARMEGAPAADPLDVIPFCDACSALLNKLFAAPYAKAMLMTRSRVEIERYEHNVRLVMEWAVKTQDVLDAVRCERFGEEAVFTIA